MRDLFNLCLIGFISILPFTFIGCEKDDNKTSELKLETVLDSLMYYQFLQEVTPPQGVVATDTSSYNEKEREEMLRGIIEGLKNYDINNAFYYFGLMKGLQTADRFENLKKLYGYNYNAEIYIKCWEAYLNNDTVFDRSLYGIKMNHSQITHEINRLLRKILEESNTPYAQEMKDKNNHQREEKSRREKAEEERIKNEGPDWLQGKWKVELKDDYGNSLGYMYSTFNHGNLKVEMGDMVFEYPYTLSDDLSEVRFSNGKYYLRNEKVISANGETMTKVSSSTSSYSSSGSPSYQSKSYQNDKEFEIMNKLKELGEKGRTMMPEVERLYQRKQQAQRSGILDTEVQFDLQKVMDKLLDIKDEQIRLAQQLGDAKLVKEYKEQRDKVQESADLMLYGTSGKVQTPY